MKETLRRFANLIFALLQVPIGYLSTVIKVGRPIGHVIPNESPVVPYRYAFAIWGLIFLASILYAFYLFRTAQKNSPFLRSIGWYTAAAFFLSCLWMTIAQFAPTALLWLTVPIIIGMFFLLLPPFNKIQYKEDYFWIGILISIYFGWICIAMFANIGSMLVQYGMGNQIVSLLLIACAGILGSYFTAKSKNVFYMLTLVWGFIGIVIANFLRIENIHAAAAAIFFLAMILISFVSAKLR